MNFYNNLDKAMENLSKRGAFLTTKSKNEVNTMTISWGYVGFSWQKPFFVAMVRPQRHTYEFLQDGEDFTISIPYSDDMKPALTICGTKSGRDVNKEKEANIEFLPSNKVNSPIVNNCNMYYECKITYKEVLNKENLPEDIKSSVYKADDYHTLFYGEIVDCYEK